MSENNKFQSFLPPGSRKIFHIWLQSFIHDREQKCEMFEIKLVQDIGTNSLILTMILENVLYVMHEILS